MGAGQSTSSPGAAAAMLATEEGEEILHRLARFVGPAAIPFADPFWNELLSFPTPLPSLRPVVGRWVDPGFSQLTPRLLSTLEPEI